MRFHADLHVHSKYSRATSKQCDLENYAFWARKKGIAVVATGDFTHPVWLADLKQKLRPAEPGLFRLHPDIEEDVAARLPAACSGATRFMLSVEISTIYKKGDLTRKVHHLIYAPDFDAADEISGRLARIGNIESDGRPILGLDSRDLLEITLESSAGAYLVPAHIWTPWFSALGSRSGFDSIGECYGDLADHIFAVETGLSSDPPMNWRVSSLDRYRMVSNSDAHSPAKLAREAVLFDTEPDYFAIRKALETGEGYGGTVEFFPEEGKYHMDGHRKCSVRLSPEETLEHDGRCPACGQAVTVGVMHRVDVLADRAEAETVPPATAGGVSNLVPLPEILSEILGTGPASKKVGRSYEQLVASLGSELSILETVPIEDIRRADSPVLAEAILRLRAGEVIRESGYDGEYGVIRLFEKDELRRRTGGGLLFDLPASETEKPALEISKNTLRPKPPPPVTEEKTTGIQRSQSNGRRKSPTPAASGILADLDEEQRAAAEIVKGPLMIVAGPGSGKTRTLTYRMAHLLMKHGVPKDRCLAITFTRRAASEMKERLASLFPKDSQLIPVYTFHSLGCSILRERPEAAGLQSGFYIADENGRAALLKDSLGFSLRKARVLLRAISQGKRTERRPEGEAAEILEAYQRAMEIRNWVDFDDLVGLPLRILESDPDLAASYCERYPWISVDEFQDVDPQQYRFVKLLSPANDANLCVIGDANQAIYGFRGADVSCFHRFETDYPKASVVRLKCNYRSSGTIVQASSQVIAPSTDDPEVARVVRDMRERITIHTARTDRAEAEFVVHTIERIIGGHSFYSIDTGRAANGGQADLSFSDFAVLYRTDAQASVLCEALSRSGMPFQKHSHERLSDQPGVQAIVQKLHQHAEGSSLRLRLKAAAEQLLSETETNEGTGLRAALQQLTALAESCGDDPGRFAEALLLATEADGWDSRADRVSLLTLHAAKGLEFPVVFIVGLEDGLLPLHWGDADDTAVEEERRLLYVGMTRAEDRLFLSRAVKRHWRGGLRTFGPSPYLSDIENTLLEQNRVEAPKKKQADHQLALL